MNPTENRSNMPEIVAKISGKEPFPCSTLFGRGVKASVETGVSIRELLCGQLGIDEAYLEGRIQTIFLNGRPVDDVGTARVADGDVLSLSAAMPGLVGATLRRGGPLAAMRGTISYADSQKKEGSGKGIVTIKLFNMVARELGPGFLRRGVIVTGRDLSGPLKAAEKDLETLEQNGAPVSMAQLSDLFNSDREVFLQVEISS
ncbi:MAG: hypothetical protein K9K88_03275 [Desulfobacterales bacterium]|nr:hypothetical protein [Desulfobacterales bacterium]